MFPRTRKFHPEHVGFFSTKSASLSKRNYLRSLAPGVREPATRFVLHHALASRQGQLGNELACIARTQPRWLGAELNLFSSTPKTLLRAVSKPQHSGDHPKIECSFPFKIAACLMQWRGCARSGSHASFYSSVAELQSCKLKILGPIPKVFFSMALQARFPSNCSGHKSPNHIVMLLQYCICNCTYACSRKLPKEALREYRCKYFHIRAQQKRQYLQSA